MMKTCMVMAILIATTAATSHAAMVTDWRTYRGTAATTLSGQGTDDPVVGNAASPASTAFLIGHLGTPAVLGADEGDGVVLRFGVHFNDAAGFANVGDNFRWALFDLNGEAADLATGGVAGGPNYATAGTSNTDNFRGYWFGHRGGGGGGSGGSIRERPIALTAATDNPFSNTGADPANSLGPVGGTAVPLTSDVNGNGAGADYTGVMKLTRNALGGIDLTGSFIGTNVVTGNVFSATDATPTSATYGAVGFLIAGPLNVDQAIFSNVQVFVVPEPASVLILVGGFACLLPLRRRVWK